jgi:hypothetical protein
VSSREEPVLAEVTATVLDQAATLAAELAVLRELIALAGEAPALSDDQLRARLMGVLAGLARSGCCRGAHDPRVASEAPAGHRLRDAPESAPGGQPAPDPATGDVAIPGVRTAR